MKRFARALVSGGIVAMLAVAAAFGTARAQGQLKQNLLGVVSYVYPHPELTIGQAAEKFDADGQLKDERTREQLRALLAGFADFVGRLR